MAGASRKLAPPVLGPVSRRTISRAVADAMRAAIVTGTFTAGEHRAEVALAKQFKVSRAPIREAMLHLSMLDVEFHDYIVQYPGHSRLYGAWANLRHQIELWLGRMYARLNMPTDRA